MVRALRLGACLQPACICIPLYTFRCGLQPTSHGDHPLQILEC